MLFISSYAITKKTFHSIKPANKTPRCDAWGFCLLVLYLKSKRGAEKERYSPVVSKLAGKNEYYQTELNPNHIFQTAKTASPDEYIRIEETVSPVTLELIGGWILEKTELKEKYKQNLYLC